MWARVRKKGTLRALLVEMENDAAATLEVPQEIKLKTPHDAAIPQLGTHPKEMQTGSRRGICAPTFTGGIIYKSQDMETT